MRIVYIILHSIIALSVESKNIRNFQHRADNSTSKITTDGAVNGAKLAATCMSALMSNIPPEFCWKKGGDAGKIPTGCPDGYHRSLALCYKDCKDDMKFVAGVCWQRCNRKRKYRDRGLICYKNFFRWHFKDSYIPSSITNFDSRVPCQTGRYKSGALCYKDCNNINMVNCGIGSCAASSDSCGSSIATIALDVLQGVADAVMFAMSFGTSTAVTTAKNTVEKSATKAGTSALKQTLKTLKAVFKGKFKDQIVKDSLASVKKTVKEKGTELVSGTVTDATVSTFCNTIWESAEDKTLSADAINVDALVSAVDIFGVSGIVTSCQDTKGTNNGVACASSVMASLSTFDPTGLLTIANAFMKPSCNVDLDDNDDDSSSSSDDDDDDDDDDGSDDYSDDDRRKRLHHKSETTQEEEETTQTTTTTEQTDTTQTSTSGTSSSDEDDELIDNIGMLTQVAARCIILYDQCNFQGEQQTVCSDKYSLEDFKYRARSLITGTQASGHIFQYENYNGIPFKFSPAQIITCFDDLNTDTIKLQDLIASIKFNTQNCLIVNYNEKVEIIDNYSSNQFICETTTDTDIIFPENLERLSFIPNSNNIYTLYSETDFEGDEWKLDSNDYEDIYNYDNLPFTHIRSVKIQEIQDTDNDDTNSTENDTGDSTQEENEYETENDDE